MKKRRMEWVFIIFMVALAYIVFFTDVPFLSKVISIALYGGMILITVFSLMLENRTAQNTLLWIYILVFLPILGYIIYVYSGQLLLKGYLFKSKRIKDREVFERMSHKHKKIDFSQLNYHQHHFTHYLDRATSTPTNSHTQTKILKNGEETFREIKNALIEAKDFIHLEYYIFRDDRLGNEIIDILTDKAQEGVEVRLMYDAVGSITLSSGAINRMKDAGIKVQPFLPLKSGLINQKFNFRNHRKIIVIDGKVGFVGGLNIGVEYLGEDENIGFWCDTHVLVEGDAVQTLHAVFLLDWRYVSGKILVMDERYMKPNPAPSDGLIHVVATGPETKRMSDHYYAMISCATKSIWIASPYFVPNPAIRTALRIAAHKGIQIRIMVPDTNDGFLTQYATRSYLPELLRAGVEVYAYQKGFLHKKVMIVDGDLATIGTANMDMRSFRLNFEVNLFLIGAKSIQDLVAHYEEDLKECLRIRPVEFYKRGLTERVKESFARLFSGVL
ncbi:cardiolipin synthase [Bacillus sp. AFS073361]|uniref:cardiolipin synthase n=1 Tax=Bacillus sp. AFS073361 TaxID=2033511 RepID=UPI000BF41207|nr:cardiolipin synthase [Bacillus sp. AFS073361]PFP30922.1 cardiolipin synthase [Bacillus sp. AFS073361]